MKPGFLRAVAVAIALGLLSCTALIAEAQLNVRPEIQAMFPGACTLAEFVPGAGVVDSTTTSTAGAGYIVLDYDSQAEQYDTAGEWTPGAGTVISACFDASNPKAKTFMVGGSLNTKVSITEAIAGASIYKDGVVIQGTETLSYRTLNRFRPLVFPAVRVVIEPGECLDIRVSSLFTSPVNTTLDYAINAREVECHDRHL